MNSIKSSNIQSSKDASKYSVLKTNCEKKKSIETKETILKNNKDNQKGITSNLMKNKKKDLKYTNSKQIQIDKIVKEFKEFTLKKEDPELKIKENLTCRSHSRTINTKEPFFRSSVSRFASTKLEKINENQTKIMNIKTVKESEITTYKRKSKRGRNESNYSVKKINNGEKIISSYSISKEKDIKRININLDNEELNKHYLKKNPNVTFFHKLNSKYANSKENEMKTKTILKKNSDDYLINSKSNKKENNHVKSNENSFLNETKYKVKLTNRQNNNEIITERPLSSLMNHSMTKTSNEKNSLVTFESKQSNLKFIFKSPSNIEKRIMPRPFSQINEELYSYRKPQVSETNNKSFSQTKSKSQKKQDKTDSEKSKIRDFKLNTIRKPNGKSLKIKNIHIKKEIYDINKFENPYLQTESVKQAKPSPKIKNKVNSHKNYCFIDNFLKSNLKDQKNAANLKFNQNKSGEASKRSIQSSELSSISIKFIRNWGNEKFIGLTKIQILDSNLNKISVSDYKINCEADNSIKNLFSGNCETTQENDMWISPFLEDLTIELFYQKCLNPESIIIWNFNGKDISIGAKIIEIYKNKKQLWIGEINRGSNSLNINYSTHISLQKVKLNSKINSEISLKRYKLPESGKDVTHFGLTVDFKKNMSIDNSQFNFVNRKKLLNNSHSKSYENLKEESSIISYHPTIEENSPNFQLCNSEIKVKILSNYGNKFFVGLSNFLIFNSKSQVISHDEYQLETQILLNEDQQEYENPIFFYNYIQSDELCFTIYFKSPTYISGFEIWNYIEKDNLDKCAKEIEIYIDKVKISNSSILLRKSIPNKNLNFGQFIDFPLKSLQMNEEDSIPFFEFKPANLFLKQEYDTPYLPTGFILKIIIESNWGSKEKIILNDIKIFNQIGIEVSKDNYDILIDSRGVSKSEREIVNESYYDDCFPIEFFVIFKHVLSISYILFTKTEENHQDGVKEISIFFDDLLIFRGNLKKSDVLQNLETCVFFSSDINIIKNLEKKIFNTNGPFEYISSKRENNYYLSLVEES